MKKLFKKKLKRLYKNFKQAISNTSYISIGENCLTDNILDRHNLKSFSTPYSHGRSNLDYIIKLESEGYKNLLNSKYLYHDHVGETKVVRNKYYSTSDNIYLDLHQNGFEFTHHDVINNDAHKNSYERKILRMLSLNNSKKLKFLYHYRDNANKDINKIIIKASEFLAYYQKRNIKCEFIFFTQDVILNQEERSVIKVHDTNNIKGYVFKTLDAWGGDDPDLLWARKDDDLIKEMIKEIK
ncbi:DUF1796 family putative cysteine peptidase [Winogradskyella sp. Asnod2-B02-A]|uniref:DUF1796 family putative cysteine peptidase n=1 Tax=Winogradskyella sp. Asnod2-B02-A TaxID=3160583 RepID=UPI0038663A14